MLKVGSRKHLLIGTLILMVSLIALYSVWFVWDYVYAPENQPPQSHPVGLEGIPLLTFAGPLLSLWGGIKAITWKPVPPASIT